MPPKQRKIAVMGCKSVGKSSLCIQFVEGQFVDSYDPTIENTFTKSTRINSQEFELNVVDTAGQDEYSIFPYQYSIDVHGYVLVYSITSAQSFKIVKLIYDKLLDIVGKGHVPLVLVGNKTDLHMQRRITEEEGKKLAESWNCVFLETSAKKNSSVSDVFHSLIHEIEKANGNVQEKSSCIVS
ncbi:GTP-binding protein Rheb homolog [Atheta coriaria]|uniref:GTP-binding protein Rheb homolog n=1 Tax=Dalotia coriaria TaxID=877792 RepID=UPI0031F38587